MATKEKLRTSGDSEVLTEELVLLRTRTSDLENVRKLNCWASNIGDVSIVRRMPNLEVCSLTINKITSLRDFAHCHNLQELYVRTNSIQQLSDIHYLKHLKKLRSLWLSENPCATCNNYRMTVLKTLPNLQKLDNIPVTGEEVERAQMEGYDLPFPEDFSLSSIFCDPGSSSEDQSGEKSMGSVSESSEKWARPRQKRQQKKREDYWREKRGTDEDNSSARSGDDGGSESTRRSDDGGGESTRRSDDGGGESTRRSDDGGDNAQSGSDVGGDAQSGDDGGSGNTKSRSDGGDDGTWNKLKSEKHKSIPVTGDTGLEAGKKEQRGTVMGVDEPETRSSSESRNRAKWAVNVKDTITTERGDSVRNESNTDVIDEEIEMNRDNCERNEVLDEEETGTCNKRPLAGSTSAEDKYQVSSAVYRSLSSHEGPCDQSLACSVPEEVRSDQALLSVSESVKDISMTVFTSNESNNNSIVSAPSDTQCGHPTSHDQHTSQPRAGKEDSEEAKMPLLDKVGLEDFFDIADSQDEKFSFNTFQQKGCIDSTLQKHHWSGEMPSSATGGKVINSESVVELAGEHKKPVDWEQYNRLRVEVGVKPLERIPSTAKSVSTEVVRARNSNILQAVLCLVKELDKDSLDIVAGAVRGRLDSLRSC